MSIISICLRMSRTGAHRSFNGIAKKGTMKIEFLFAFVMVRLLVVSRLFDVGRKPSISGVYRFLKIEAYEETSGNESTESCVQKCSSFRGNHGIERKAH